MVLPNKETTDYIYEHRNEDVNKLVLKKRVDTNIDYDFAIRQIAGKQRITQKIPTFYNTKNIVFPAHLNIEQCSSESTALYKKSICEGDTFIDITAGFGVDFFFISQKFKQAIYVERNEELCRIAEHNFSVLAAENITIINMDALDFIHKMPAVDCLLVDPARRDKAGGKTVFLSDCEPDITKIYKQLLTKTKFLMLKLSPMIDISAAIHQLSNVHEVHVVSVANECKEILLILKPGEVEKIQHKTVNIKHGKATEYFDFTKEEEMGIACNYSANVLNYLYEPNSSILKAGAFKCISNSFKLSKLQKNTHLYTSEILLSEFPGRSFRVHKVWEFGKKEMIELKKQHPKANLSTRNFPLKPEELKKKIGIADGGETYLFGCTLVNHKKVIIACERITSIA